MYVHVHETPDVKTMLVKLNDIFPECSVLLKPYPQLFNLNCFKNNFCPAQSACMEKLVPRIRFLFDSFSEVGLILALFRSPDDKLMAGLFQRSGVEPRVIRVGPKGFDRFKKYVETYEIEMPSELMNLVGKESTDVVSKIGLPKEHKSEQ